MRQQQYKPKTDTLRERVSVVHLHPTRLMFGENPNDAGVFYDKILRFSRSEEKLQQHTQDLLDTAARRQSRFISISRIDVIDHLTSLEQQRLAWPHRLTLSLLGPLVCLYVATWIVLFGGYLQYSSAGAAQLNHRGSVTVIPLLLP